MDHRISRPAAKRLTLPPEKNPEQTPQGNQRHVGHDGRDISVRQNPRRDKLGIAIAPEVLVDSDSDKDGTGHGFVRIDRVS